MALSASWTAIWVIASVWVWGPGGKFAATRFDAKSFQVLTALLRLALVRDFDDSTPFALCALALAAVIEKTSATIATRSDGDRHRVRWGISVCRFCPMVDCWSVGALVRCGDRL
jgi:hypothetical protein